MQEKLQGYRGQETSFPDAQFLPKAGVSQGGRKQINTVCDLLLTSDTSESLWSTLSISPQGPHPAGPGSCGRVLSEGPYYCRLPQVLPSALRFYSHHQQPWTHLPKPWDRKSLPFPWHWEERGTVNASWRRWGGAWPSFIGNSLSPVVKAATAGHSRDPPNGKKKGSPSGRRLEICRRSWELARVLQDCEEVNLGGAEVVGGQTVRNRVKQTNFGHRMKDHESSAEM